MAIAVDASSPPIKNAPSLLTPMTSASFTPPVGSLLVAIACAGYSNTTGTATISGSQAGTWTSKATANGASSGGGVVQISVRPITVSAAQTVTATFVMTGGGGQMLAVYVLTGANTSSFGAAGTLSVTTSLTTWTKSLTTTQAGSLVVGAAESAGTGGITMTAGTNLTTTTGMTGTNPVANNTDFVGYGIVKASSVTGTPGATNFTVSWNSVDNGNMALLEILPAAATGPTGTISSTLPAPLTSSFSGGTISGPVSATLPHPLTSNFAGVASPPSGPLAATLPHPLVGTFSGNTPTVGTVSAQLPSLSSSFAGAEAGIGSVSTVLPKLVANFATETRPHGENVILVEEEARAFTVTQDDLIPVLKSKIFKESIVKFNLPKLSTSISGTVAPAGSVSATLPKLQTALDGTTLPRGVVGAQLPHLGVSFAAVESVVFVADWPDVQTAANLATGGSALIFPSGHTYEVYSLLIPASCRVIGNGSTLRFADGVVTDPDQSAPILAVTGSNVTIDGLNFDGNIGNQSVWSQHMHCIGMEGTFSTVEVKNCNFTNIVGDGVYISTQTGSGISVHDCVFTGTNSNRNGVSVVSGTNVNIYSNTFTRMARPDMPGAVDVEPNFSTDVVSGVHVYSNVINGGSEVVTSETISALRYFGVANPAANDITFHDNEIYGEHINSAITIVGIDTGPFNSATNIDVYNNNIHDISTSTIGNFGGIGVELDWWIGADVYNNTFTNMVFGIYNYKACLGTSTGNTYSGIVTSNTVVDTPHCS